MPYTVKTPPASAGLSIPLADVKEHLNIEASFTDHDNQLNRIRIAVEEFALQYFNREFIDTVLTLKLTGFPKSREIALRSPVQSVASVKYYDADGNLQTWDSANYELVKSRRGQDKLYILTDPPTVDDDKPFPVEIEHTSGYGSDDTNVPKDIKLFMLGVIGSLYIHREELSLSNVTDIKDSIRSVVNTKRNIRFA